MPKQVFNPLFVPIIFLIALFVAQVLIRRSSFFKGEVAQEPGRSATLDGFRGYLALGVVIHHALSNYQMGFTGTWGAPSNYAFYFLGRGSVDFFFMITGYLFWDKCIRADGLIGIRKLALSRLRRIMPLYCFSAALVIAAALAMSGIVPRVPLDEYVLSLIRWLVGGGLFGMPDINGISTHHINAGVTWTLEYEWYFYLALPLLGWIARPGLKRPYLLPFLIPIVLLLFQQVGCDPWYSGRFLQGMAAAHLLRVVPTIRGIQSKKVALILLLSLLPCAWRPLPFRLEYWITYAVFLGVLYGNDLLGSLSNAPARLLGHISYSIYLMHGLVFFFIIELIGRDWFNQLSTLGFWLWSMPASALVVLFASQTYRWVEKPFLRSSPIRLPANGYQSEKSTVVPP